MMNPYQQQLLDAEPSHHTPWIPMLVAGWAGWSAGGIMRDWYMQNQMQQMQQQLLMQQYMAMQEPQQAVEYAPGQYVVQPNPDQYAYAQAMAMLQAQEYELYRRQQRERAVSRFLSFLFLAAMVVGFVLLILFA